MRFSAVVAPKPSDCRAIAYGLDAVVSGTAFQVPAWDETQKQHARDPVRPSA